MLCNISGWKDDDNNIYDGDDFQAAVWRQKWGSQFPCEVSAERMSGFRET